MLTLRSDLEIDRMRRAGLLVWHGLQIAGSMMRAGVKTIEVDSRVEQFFLDQKAIPLFKGYPGGRHPFPGTICISVNEEVVHGIPGGRVLQDGDIVSVDTGAKIDGWCGDSALTFPVGEIDAESKRLLDVTRRMLEIAIESLPSCSYWSEVARKMESHAKEAGYSVIETLVGHGIGREMHEDPQVPNYVCSEILRAGDFRVQPGLVIAIEPMVNAGKKTVKTLSDHWTIVTIDKKRSAHFEHTVAVTRGGVRVLTGPPQNESEKIDISAYCD